MKKLKGGTNIPLIGLDGKTKNRRKVFFDAEDKKKKIFRKKTQEPKQEAPICPKCKAEGRATFNRCRQDGFGNYLGECLEHAVNLEQERLV